MDTGGRELTRLISEKIGRDGTSEKVCPYLVLEKLKN